MLARSISKNDEYQKEKNQEDSNTAYVHAALLLCLSEILQQYDWASEEVT